MSGTTGTDQSKQNGLAGFEDTVKDFWVSRPRRPRTGRKILGVAAGVGNRYGIDPVIIRVALVVTSFFGGSGILFYLLGALLLPAEHDEVSAFESLIRRGSSSASPLGTLLLCAALIAATSGVFGGIWFDGGGLIGFAMLTVSIYLLHRERGHLNRPELGGPPESMGTGAAEFTNESIRQADAQAQGVTPLWDPLAARPLSWDLPDPNPAPPIATPPSRPEPKAPRRKSKIGIATFGLALLVSGVGALLNVIGIEWFSVAHIIGLALGVIGAGMVAGAFLRGGRGLIALAFPLGCVGVLLTFVTSAGGLHGGIGDMSVTPRTADEVLPTYEHAVGQHEIDFRALDASRPIETTIHSGIGSTTVWVPETADVEFSCKNAVGDVSCLGRGQSGLGTSALTGNDLGPDGQGGLKLKLDVSGVMGTMEVRRG